jgi:HSP20 family protein
MKKALVLFLSFAVTAVCLFAPTRALMPFTGGRYGDIWDSMVDPFNVLDNIPKDIEAVALSRVDWKETTDAHVFTVDVPGMKKDDIKIEVDDNRVLRFSGERRKEEKEEGDKWHRVERSAGKFWRQFRLPDNLNMDAIRASLDNGVLTVSVPKISDFKSKNAKVIDIIENSSPKTEQEIVGKVVL